MGLRGPKPTPTPILQMRGSRVLERREKAGEVEYALGAPVCPKWLPRVGKAEWRRLVPYLEEKKLLAKVDLGALAGYCSAWAELAWATETIEREGRTFENHNGIRPHPAVMMQRTAWQALKQFAALFGLDPADRARVNVPAGDDDDGGVMSRRRAE